jgi:uncharacterized membrane protein
VKKYLLTGLLVWIPIGITLWVLNLVVSTLDQSLLLLPVEWTPQKLLGINIPGFGTLLSLIVVLVTGLLARNIFGQQLLRFWEGLLQRIPVVNSIYNSVKQVSDTLLSSNGQSFRKVLLVRYPHPEAWSLAFQTTIPGDVRQQLKEEYVGVFIPTAPSPVNGFYFYVRKADTIELNMNVDAALKTIISMGVVAQDASPLPIESIKKLD